ncbi:DNA-directed RNA polymerases II and V subunit 8A-like [Impatiens glandulifera]|uniref:DNA-directed RNA polymerases II and V subunit 8A-like n=1 Tax=Impatiens glandulifera TaxID=253017 RepID=UPI001FB06D1E|nr:DNA-directed RNA polymerases II and V subunit 8A-like [Impatiens glandulifera]
MIDIYFDDVMKVEQLDPDGKKFDKVSRIVAKSEKSGAEMLLDVNTSIYQILVGDKLRMALTTSLNGSIDSEGNQISLADKFEYVMHGLLYKMSDEISGGQAKVLVYISFGGLQLMLKGDPILMGKFKVDQNLFLLIRKI